VFLSSEVAAKVMVCMIPADTQNIKLHLKTQSHIKLLEAKTKIEFDVSNKITNFTSPGCHKTQTVAFWSDSIEIGCKANNAKLVNLKVNLATLSFIKSYSNQIDEMNSFSGFCLIKKR
jgi:hypothetical protein